MNLENQHRHFSKAQYTRSLKNGEKVARECFSPSTGKVYCFFCTLFSDTKSALSDCRFCHWKNAAHQFEEQEM